MLPTTCSQMRRLAGRHTHSWPKPRKQISRVIWWTFSIGPWTALVLAPIPSSIQSLGVRTCIKEWVPLSPVQGSRSRRNTGQHRAHLCHHKQLRLFAHLNGANALVKDGLGHSAARLGTPASTRTNTTLSVFWTRPDPERLGIPRMLLCWTLMTM